MLLLPMMGEKIGALLELTNTYENPSMLNFRRNLSASTETDSDKTNEMKTQNYKKLKKRAKKRVRFYHSRQNFIVLIFAGSLQLTDFHTQSLSLSLSRVFFGGIVQSREGQAAAL